MMKSDEMDMPGFQRLWELDAQWGQKNPGRASLIKSLAGGETMRILIQRSIN